MSLESKRAAIFGYVQAQWAAGAYASTPIEYENREQIDHNNRVDPFITVEIEHMNDAHQSDMAGAASRTRYNAELVFHIHVKQGSGTKTALQLADAITSFMKYTTSVAGVTFRAPRPAKSVPFDGWYITPLYVSFVYDE